MTTAERLMELFKGMEEAHGCYILDPEETDPGKKKKGKAWTSRDPLTLELWEAHVKGEDSVGVIPINRDNQCYWGAIDIDVYDLDIASFARRVYSIGLPMFPLRSKSGGCHLAVFLKEPIEARAMQLKLGEIAASLGFGQSEIFPKQSQVLLEKGDLANWLNMPYFGGDRGNRYALDNNGEMLLLADFLKKAEKGRLTHEEFEEIEAAPVSTELVDGPPCLQALVAQGFPQGTRNDGLFALGGYCRKAFPDTWDTVLEEFNQKYMDPPLDSKEVQTVSKQVRKKDYNYRCNTPPIRDFCNSNVCRTRKFGIGGSAMPMMSGLAKIPTDQPVWFLDVNGTRLELQTEELQIQYRFQKVCMNTINFMPPKIADRQWQNLIQVLLDNCEILEKPPEASIADQFRDLLHAFCTDSRMKSKSKEELLLGRPWTGPDPEGGEGEKTFFRLKDFEEFLLRHNFKYYNRSQMSSRLSSEDIEAKTKFFNIKGKGTNTWYIAAVTEQDAPFDIPDMNSNVV